MGDSPDDEALARELHRELNVGPRRRQRRQAAPPNRSNISHKRARSAGSASRDSTTNDDSDEFSDRVIPRSIPKPGQRRGSEPKEDGQVESMPKAIGQLQRSQTAPNPSTGEGPLSAGTANGPKTAVPTIPPIKASKASAATVAPKSHNLSFARKPNAPAVQKQTTPPKSPRHKKPKFSPPAAVKPSKDIQTTRPSSLPAPHRTGSRQPTHTSASQKKPIADFKASLAGKVPLGIKSSTHPKIPSRIVQASASAGKSMCRDSTNHDDQSAAKLQKERTPQIPDTSVRLERPPPPPASSVRVSHSTALHGKVAACEAAGAQSAPKAFADEELKPVRDVKPLSHDCKPKLGSEHQKSAFKPGAEQDRFIVPEEQEAAAPPQKVTQFAHDVSAAAQKAGVARPKLSEPERKPVIAAHHLAAPRKKSVTGAEQPGPLKHETASPATKIQQLHPNKDANKTRKELTTSVHQAEEHVQKVFDATQSKPTPAQEAPALPAAAPATTPLQAEEAIVAVPTGRVESPKAASIHKGRADFITSAGSAPRAPELERNRPCGVDQQPAIRGEQGEPEAVLGGSKHEAEDVINDHGAAATPAAQMKSDVDTAQTARAQGSSSDARKEAFDLMNLCPAHEISSRGQLGAALSTLYPGAKAANRESSSLAVTLVNLRGKQYFHFPANTEFALQGNVPWQEASAQATHMLITV